MNFVIMASILNFRLIQYSQQLKIFQCKNEKIIVAQN